MKLTEELPMRRGLAPALALSGVRGQNKKARV